jgi:hypothetical protein
MVFALGQGTHHFGAGANFTTENCGMQAKCFYGRIKTFDWVGGRFVIYWRIKPGRKQ